MTLAGNDNDAEVVVASRESESERLALEESARFIGHDLSPHRLRSWAKQGRISYLKVGRRLFFEKADLMEFLRRSRVEAIPR